MTIVSKVTRFFLLLGAVSIGATGFKYIQGSRNGTLSTGPLSTVFEPEIFKGYGLEALAPFAGIHPATPRAPARSVAANSTTRTPRPTRARRRSTRQRSSAR